MTSFTHINNRRRLTEAFALVTNTPGAESAFLKDWRWVLVRALAAMAIIQSVFWFAFVPFVQRMGAKPD